VLACAATFGVERAVAQEPETMRALESELAAMRATIQALKEELVRLQDRNAELQADERTIARQRRATNSLLSQPSNAPDAHADQQPPPGATQDPAADPLATTRFDGHRRTPDGPPGSKGIYTVQKGDTLERVARQFYRDGDVERLLRLNPGLDPQRLRIGQRLHLDLESPAPTDDPTTPDTQPEPAGARTTGTTSLRSPTGVADLVTRCIELRGEVEIAEIEVARAAEAAKNGVQSEYDIRIAEVKLRTKRDQYKTLESMLRDEFESAMRERKAAAALAQKGFVSDADVDRLDNLIKLLKRAL
jgi:hypothetical protein